MCLGTLEHEVLKEVGYTRFAGRFVGRSDLVPKHVGDHRCAAIGNDNHFQTVIEREGGEVGADNRRGLRILGGRGNRREGNQRGNGGEGKPLHPVLQGWSFQSVSNQASGDNAVRYRRTIGFDS